eukprot:7104072-Prymnesium_polylepis.1
MAIHHALHTARGEELPRTLPRGDGDSFSPCRRNSSEVPRAQFLAHEATSSRSTFILTSRIHPPLEQPDQPAAAHPSAGSAARWSSHSRPRRPAAPASVGCGAGRRAEGPRSARRRAAGRRCERNGKRAKDEGAEEGAPRRIAQVVAGRDRPGAVGRPFWALPRGNCGREPSTTGEARASVATSSLLGGVAGTGDSAAPALGAAFTTASAVAAVRGAAGGVGCCSSSSTSSTRISGSCGRTAPNAPAPVQPLPLERRRAYNRESASWLLIAAIDWDGGVRQRLDGEGEAPGPANCRRRYGDEYCAFPGVFGGEDMRLAGASGAPTVRREAAEPGGVA